MKTYNKYLKYSDCVWSRILTVLSASIIEKVLVNPTLWFSLVLFCIFVFPYLNIAISKSHIKTSSEKSITSIYLYSAFLSKSFVDWDLRLLESMTWDATLIENCVLLYHIFSVVRRRFRTLEDNFPCLQRCRVILTR